ncbi:MAG: hypothetical protein ABI723_21950 [Bacteroidia bacterium]
MKTITEDVVITESTYMHDYVIKFTFSDGSFRAIDFYPFLTSPHQNPAVKKYLDVTHFKKFVIKRSQDISWDNYEMCFPFETLYTGKF